MFLHRRTTLFAVALLTGSGLVLLARQSGWQPGLLCVAVSWTPYLLIPIGLAAGLAVWAKAWPVALAGGLLVVPLLLMQAPLFAADGAAGAPVMRMGTINLQYGQGDASEVVSLVREERVDLLAVEELTPGAVERLSAAGLDAELPFRFVLPEPAAGGTGLWSRWPLRDARQVSGMGAASLLAVTDVPGVGTVTTGALHPARPDVFSHRLWSAEHSRLRAELGGLSGTVVVAGDFNATLDHAPMRRLLRDGYADAADSAGAGLNRTWPHGFGLPTTMISLDHVLTRGPLVGTAVRGREISGSDHGAVVAEIAVRGR